MNRFKHSSLASSLAGQTRAPSDFGIIGHPKQGDAMQVNIPSYEAIGENGKTIHPAMAGALGQTINMSFNTPSPHLTFKEWMARGVVGGIGQIFAFPFVFCGKMITAAGTAVVDIIKMAIVVILVPTLLWMGYMLYQKVSQSQSIEEGAAIIVSDAKKVGNGISNGVSAKNKPAPKPEQ